MSNFTDVEERIPPIRHGSFIKDFNGSGLYWCAECSNEYVFDHKHFKDIEKLETKSNLEVSPSGATTSKLDIRFDLVPQIFIKRVAQRFSLGIKKGHTEYNWRQGITDPVFIQARINHMLNHLNLFLTEGNDKDDNLAAIAWGISMLMEFESRQEGQNSIRQVIKTMNFKALPTIEELEQILGEDREKEQDEFKNNTELQEQRGLK